MTKIVYKDKVGQLHMLFRDLNGRPRHAKFSEADAAKYRQLRGDSDDLASRRAAFIARYRRLRERRSP
jgi:hypothetical protein